MCVGEHSLSTHGRCSGGKYRSVRLVLLGCEECRHSIASEYIGTSEGVMAMENGEIKRWAGH